eukprot:11957301-Heterocapsa_arctica.AAC.1
MAFRSSCIAAADWTAIACTLARTSCMPSAWTETAVASAVMASAICASPDVIRRSLEACASTSFVST